MTALPEDSADGLHLFTVAEYAELGETEFGYSELQEGRILMSPSPGPRHMMASGELFVRLRDQLPADLVAIQDGDVDLELAPRGDPGLDAGDVVGEFTTSVPFPVTVEVDGLV